MTELRQRTPRERDQRHIDYVNKLPCCVCGSTRNVEAAHLKLRLPEVGKVEAPGMQMKEDDRWVTPLCHYHHLSGILAQHRIGEQRFWFEIHGRNPFEIAARLWVESGGAARAAERAENPKPVKPRKINPRDRMKPKRQIPARPAMQSRSTFQLGRKIQNRGFEKPPTSREPTPARIVQAGRSRPAQNEGGPGHDKTKVARHPKCDNRRAVGANRGPCTNHHQDDRQVVLAGLAGVNFERHRPTAIEE